MSVSSGRRSTMSAGAPRLPAKGRQNDFRRQHGDRRRGWVAIHEDITERVRHEEALFQQATELARTNMRFDTR